MNPIEEAKSMQKYPPPQKLPEAMVYTTCPSEQVLLTIAYLDDEIKSEQERVAYLQEQRKILIDRALIENIESTGRYELIRIPQPLRRNKINNIRKFAERFPEGYEMIRKQQQLNMEDKLHRDLLALPNSEIPLTLADAKIGKDAVTEYVGYQIQEIKAEVRKMPEMLK